jgi:hypothetical protein
MRVTPCPSPRGTNHENLYLVKLPRSTPAGALDAALRKAKDCTARDDDPSQVNLGELRRKLEHYLQQALPESHYQSAIDMLDECGLPGGQVYGEAGTQDADPDATAESLWTKYPDHAQDVRKYLADRGFSDDDIEEAIGKMPKNAIEDRRGGRDRRRGAMDRQLTAADSFEAMYGTSRIKHGPF